MPALIELPKFLFSHDHERLAIWLVLLKEALNPKNEELHFVHWTMFDKQSSVNRRTALWQVKKLTWNR